MSYDVSLCDPVTGDVLEAGETFQEGGAQRVGGTGLCELNITYNYCEVFGPLVRDLNGQTAEDTQVELQMAYDRWLGAKPYKRDYWAPTPGNAKAAIERLLTFARRHPNGVWRVT